MNRDLYFDQLQQMARLEDPEKSIEGEIRLLLLPILDLYMWRSKIGPADRARALNGQSLAFGSHIATIARGAAKSAAGQRTAVEAITLDLRNAAMSMIEHDEPPRQPTRLVSPPDGKPRLVS